MSTFLDTMINLDVPTFDDHADQPPRMYWHNGDKRARTAGSFYIKADELIATPDAPWERVERFQDEIGFTASLLKVAVIGYRQQPFVDDKETRTRRWLTHWEPGALIYTEVLCLVAGIDVPVVWCAKGLTGRAITGKGGILAQYRSTLLRAAETSAGKPLPPWTFWLPITAAVDAQERPVYTDTGHGSFVTPPILHPQALETSTKIMDRLFVGAQWVQYGVGIRQQFDAWLRERRGQAPAAPVLEEPWE